MSAAYLVRVIDSKEFVGIFWASSIAWLAALVDEVCDPGACEFKRLSDGGFYIHGAAGIVPCDGRDGDIYFDGTGDEPWWLRQNKFTFCDTTQEALSTGRTCKVNTSWKPLDGSPYQWENDEPEPPPPPPPRRLLKRDREREAQAIAKAVYDLGLISEGELT